MALHDHCDELLLTWKQPESRERYLIGHLWRDRVAYHFRYERTLPRSLDAAISAGFRILEPFPDPARTFDAEALFPAFRRRALPVLRRQSRDVVGTHAHDDQAAFDALRETGGRMETDTFEFLEPATDHDEGAVFEFPIAGWRFHAGESVMHELRPGVQVSLYAERDNDWDPYAIQIRSPSGCQLGYVPAIYAWYLEAFVASGAYDARIVGIGATDDPQRRVLISVAIPPSSDQESQMYRPVPPGLLRTMEPATT